MKVTNVFLLYNSKEDKIMQKEPNAGEEDDVKDGIPFGLGFSLGAYSEDMENFAMMTPEERAIYEEQGRKTENVLESKQISEGIANFRIINNNH